MVQSKKLLGGLAYKAFQMIFCFSVREMNPTRGTLAYSQIEKLDKMNDWVDSPFHMVECIKRYTYYIFVAKHDKV